MFSIQERLIILDSVVRRINELEQSNPNHPEFLVLKIIRDKIASKIKKVKKQQVDAIDTSEYFKD
jgi:hypothetical protein